MTCVSSHSLGCVCSSSQLRLENGDHLLGFGRLFFFFSKKTICNFGSFLGFEHIFFVWFTLVTLSFFTVFGVTMEQHRFKWLPFSMLCESMNGSDRKVFKYDFLCFIGLYICTWKFFLILGTMNNAWDTSCLREIVILFILFTFLLKNHGLTILY